MKISGNAKTQWITIRIDPEVRKAFIAALNGQKASDYLRKVIEEKIEESRNEASQDELVR
jgi:hypothetical protein